MRDTLARRDDRGEATGWEVERITNNLGEARQKLKAAVKLADERDSKLRDRPHAVADREALDAEIDRRVGEHVDVHLADPADYIEARLGAMPERGRRLTAWTTGARLIERFRFEHGITDAEHAFGHEDPPWLLDTRLDAIHHEIEPPSRSRGMRM